MQWGNTGWYFLKGSESIFLVLHGHCVNNFQHLHSTRRGREGGCIGVGEGVGRFSVVALFSFLVHNVHNHNITNDSVLRSYLKYFRENSPA